MNGEHVHPYACEARIREFSRNIRIMAKKSDYPNVRDSFFKESYYLR